MADLASLQATVSGRVHGVFYRAYVESRAGALNLTGYVRNLPGGRVEVRAEGEQEQLEKLVRYLEMGSPAARVDKVVTRWGEYQGLFSDFRVRY
jgi:acylphosphatase